MPQTTKPITLFTKTVSFLGGFLGSTFIVALLLKISSSFWGIVFALILNGGISIYIIKKYGKNRPLKMIAIGALSAAIIITVAAIGVWTFIQAAFEGIAN